MTKNEFGLKLVRDKIVNAIEWTNSHGMRPFDPTRDRAHITLTDRQFAFVKPMCEKEPYPSKKIAVKVDAEYDGLYKRFVTKRNGSFNVRFEYNDRMGVWEGYAESEVYEK